MHRNKYINFSDNKLIKRLLEKPIFGILLHWAFQGMLYMDKSERLFKLSLDAILTLFFLPLLATKITFPYNLLLAFLVAHSMNFLFNSHFWTLLKHYGYIHNTKEKFTDYTKKLFDRISQERSVIYAAVYGSWARGEWSPHSDLDVRIVRQAGLSSGLRACMFVLLERGRAFFCHFPIDVYVLDDFSRLSNMREDENPVVIIDRH